ncbi:MAG: aspartyl/asparaginyl beta-hydroxylase domain-containing protein [Chitinophagales bacterium]|nr:aspartyl/asparaginyl beta-hydroxylase domain-containing protein [Chitinophagales bacterium]
MIAESIPENIYFYLTGNWYKGKKPHFYDVSELPSTQILEDNYEVIKEEILNFYDKSSDKIVTNYTPYTYREEGWRTLNLIANMLKQPQYDNDFPNLLKAIAQIPDVITVQISVLMPHTRIKPHFGDTDGIIRSHLGIVVPGQYPELGFRVRRTDKCWEEGKVLALCIAHRHFVWNKTDRKRIVLLIDTIHPDYKEKKIYISAGLLSAALMKAIVTKFPILKKIPKPIVRLLHKMIIIPFYIIIWLQEKFNINIAQFLQKLKF